MVKDKEKKTINLTEEEFRRYLSLIKELRAKLQQLKIEGKKIKHKILEEVDLKKAKKVLGFIQKIAD